MKKVKIHPVIEELSSIANYWRRKADDGPGGRGYSDISIHKNKYFLGMKILWIFLGGHQKIGLYLGVISMYFRVIS